MLSVLFQIRRFPSNEKYSKIYIGYLTNYYIIDYIFTLIILNRQCVKMHCHH